MITHSTGARAVNSIRTRMTSPRLQRPGTACVTALTLRRSAKPLASGALSGTAARAATIAHGAPLPLWLRRKSARAAGHASSAGGGEPLPGHAKQCLAAPALAVVVPVTGALSKRREKSAIASVPTALATVVFQ